MRNGPHPYRNYDSALAKMISIIHRKAYEHGFQEGLGAAARADSSADVYVINAGTKPAAQKKLLDAHHRVVLKTLAQNKSWISAMSRTDPIDSFVAKSFFENVSLHDFEKRELSWRMDRILIRP